MTYEQIENILDQLHTHVADRAASYGIADSAAFKGGYFAMVIETVLKSLSEDAQAQFKHLVEELINAGK
jgi:cytosine/adenosine deaminase-related metal-dependent hydrolase